MIDHMDEIIIIIIRGRTHIGQGRAPLIVPKNGDALLGGAPLVYTPDDKTAINAEGVPASQNVVCKCEKVAAPKS